MKKELNMVLLQLFYRKNRKFILSNINLIGILSKKDELRKFISVDRFGFISYFNVFDKTVRRFPDFRSFRNYETKEFTIYRSQKKQSIRCCCGDIERIVRRYFSKKIMIVDYNHGYIIVDNKLVIVLYLGDNILATCNTCNDTSCTGKMEYTCVIYRLDSHYSEAVPNTDLENCLKHIKLNN